MSTEAQAVADIVTKSTPPKFHQPDGGGTPIVLWPQIQKTESLEKYLAKPVRKRSTVIVHDYQSFIAYVLAHKEVGTAIFATLTDAAAKFVAVIDYHQPTEAGEARFAAHIVTLDMQHTPEWKNWVNHSGEEFAQAEFAQFLEDNRIDIQTPDAATIIELVKSFEATTGVQFKSAVRLDNGDREFTYNEATATKVVMPDKIGLRMPVFVNGPEYDVGAWFRFKANGSGLRLRYELIRKHKVIEVAVAEARNAIAAQTSLTVHAGVVSVPAIA